MYKRYVIMMRDTHPNWRYLDRYNSDIYVSRKEAERAANMYNRGQDPRPGLENHSWKPIQEQNFYIQEVTPES